MINSNKFVPILMAEQKFYWWGINFGARSSIRWMYHNQKFPNKGDMVFFRGFDGWKIIDRWIYQLNSVWFMGLVLGWESWCEEDVSKSPYCCFSADKGEEFDFYARVNDFNEDAILYLQQWAITEYISFDFSREILLTPQFGDSLSEEALDKLEKFLENNPHHKL